MDWLRRADWLTRERVRGYALLLALASLALLANSYLKAMGPAGTDFLAFWGAGQLTAEGAPAAAYDLAAQERVQTGTGSEGWFAFVNPPPFLFIAAPFGMLPFALAWIAWVAVTWGLWAWASIRAFPRLWPLVIAYPGALLAAGHAQTGLLTGAMLVLAAQHLARRPILSGAAIGALVIKPHLALLAPFWFAAAGRWRAFCAAGVTALMLGAASWFVFGSETIAGYTTSWRASGLLMEGINPDFLLRMTTFYSQGRLLWGDGAGLAAGAVSGLLGIAVALGAWRRFGGDARATGAAVLAATALASPRSSASATSSSATCRTATSSSSTASPRSTSSPSCPTRSRSCPGARSASTSASLCGNQPLVWVVLTKLENSLARSNRSRFG